MSEEVKVAAQSNIELFAEVVETVDIIETITKYIELKQDGTFHVGRCPFSCNCGMNFIVSRPKRSYYCFGCGSKGDVISFMAKVGSMNKLTATRFLQNLAKASKWEEKDNGETQAI